MQLQRKERMMIIKKCKLQLFKLVGEKESRVSFPRFEEGAHGKGMILCWACEE
jgi:hypothetical protein